MAAQFALVLSALLLNAARELLGQRQRAIRNTLSPSRKLPLADRRQRTALVAFILLANLFFVPNLVSAPRPEPASTSPQTNTSSSTSSQGENDVQQLELGKPVERELAGGQHHSYQVTLASGQFLHAVVEPHGIAVTVTLSGPDGKPMMKLAATAGSSEPLYLVAKEQGAYHLDMRSEEANLAGTYRIEIQELRVAAPQDTNRALAQSIFADGEQLRKQGSAESRQNAIKKYEQAIPIWQAASDRRGVAATLVRLGIVYENLSEKQKALEYLVQALPLFLAVGDRAGEAQTLYTLGRVYANLAERQKGLDYYNQALAHWRAVGDRSGEIRALINIALAYDNLGEKQKALDYTSQSLTLARAVGNRSQEGTALSNFGRVYAWLGEKQKALDFYNQAVALEHAAGNRDAEAAVLHDLGVLYDSLGQRQKALDHFNRGLALRRAVGNRDGEAGTLHDIGILYDELGEKQRALDYFNQALPLARATGSQVGEAWIIGSMGVVYDELGERLKALDCYTQALSLHRAVGDRDAEAATLGNIALMEMEQGNFVQALAHTEAAIQIVESLRTNVLSEDLRASYFSTVQHYYAVDIDVLMRLHQLHPDDGNEATALEVSERGRARSLLENLAEAQADIRQGVDPALLERERSLRPLLKGKEEAQAKLLSGKHTEEQAAALKKEINDILAQYEEVEAHIRATSPRYAALTQPRPLTPPEIQEQLDPNTLLLEYALGDEHSYLWAVGRDSLRSFQLPKRSDIESSARRFYELLTARNKQVEGETEAQRQVRLQQAEAQYPQAAAALSRMVLGPVSPLIKGKRLVIVADGALQYIPFSALPEPSRGKIASPRTATVNQASLIPLVVQHEIVSLPSASTLAVLRQEIKGRQPAPNIVAVLADPVFDSQDPRVEKTARRSDPGGPQQAQKVEGARAPEGTQAVADAETASLAASLIEGRLTRSASDVGLSRSGELHFARLAFSRREAQDILAAAPAGKGMMAVDFKANLQTATDPELSHYRIVHLATHGLLNSEHPELSGLVLSLVDQQGRPQDGFLQLQDIYNLNLPADLVVLSACETALGKEIRGEGLMGLTRGFMYAGAGRVIASLWKVDDVATAELMKRLYRGMFTDGLPPAAALRQSQIEMWKQQPWQSPFYWAAFVIQGEWK